MLSQIVNDVITVIVPIYNTEKYLERCLRSIQVQTYANLEVILVNDGSMDSSEAICRSFCNNDSRFHYFYKNNGGDSSARNYALEHVTGKYIGFVDSDDWIDRDYYETLKSCMDRLQCDVVIAGISISDGESVLFSTEPDQECMLTKQELAKRFWNADCNAFLNSQCNKLYLRDHITEQFSVDMTCGMDLRFNMLYLRNVEKIGFVQNHGYYYFKPYQSKVKYPNNDAKQCLKYSTSVKEFLESALPKESYVNDYERFLACNMCRDVYTLSKGNKFGKAIQLVKEFYSYQEFREIIRKRSWKKAPRQYAVIGELMRAKLVFVIVLASKVKKW